MRCLGLESKAVYAAVICTTALSMGQLPVNGDETPWTVLEAREAVCKLLGEPGYPAEYLNDYEHGDGRVLAHFTGRVDDAGRADIMWVDRQRRMVTYVKLWSRMDTSFYSVGGESVDHQLLDPQDAEAAATLIVQRHYPSLLHPTCLHDSDVDGSPYSFKWRQLSADGVRLPCMVVVEVDPITRQFCGWRLKQEDVVVDLPPRLTVERAIAAAGELSMAEAGALTEAYAAVIGRGESQRIVWYVSYQVGDDGLCVVVDDSSSEAAVLR